MSSLQQQNAIIQLLRQELDSIYHSPGWRVISLYRNWLHALALRWPRVHRLYDVLAVRACSWLARTSPASSTPTPVDLYEEWIQESEPSEMELEIQRETSAQFRYRPLISILVPVFRVQFAVLKAMIDSVLQQTYSNWELCIVHAEPNDEAGHQYLSDLSAQEPRVKVRLLQSNMGISSNSNIALELVSGEFIALLDHDDTLAPFALFEVAEALNDDPSLHFIYSDSDQIDVNGSKRMLPFFKPDWSPFLMLSANYVTHLSVMRSETVRNLGGFHAEVDGAQDWELFLRVTSEPGRVHHIPKVLYHWRQTQTSVAGAGYSAKPYAREAQLRTLDAYLASKGKHASASVTVDGVLQINWSRHAMKAVSVVIVSRRFSARGVRLAERIIRTSDPRPVETVVPLQERASSREPGVKILKLDQDSTVAAALNRAVEECRGEVIVFIDDTVTLPRGDWLGELTGPLQDEEVGIVGAKLVDAATGKIRHAGIVFDADGQARHYMEGMQEDQLGPHCKDHWGRELLAVSGACFAVKREVLQQTGGFSDSPDYPRLDVALCMEARAKSGWKTVYSPFARFRQDGEALLETWLDAEESSQASNRIRELFPAGDPYFHPNLAQWNGRLLFRSSRSASREADAADSVYSRLPKAVRFDFTSEELAASATATAGPGTGIVRNVTWFLPDFRHAFYGGIHTVLRFADYCLREHGVRSTFAVLPPSQERQIRHRIAAAFGNLAEASEIRILQDASALPRLERSDAAVATHWTTAFQVLKYNLARRKFYLIQDDEVLFYPAGSTSALVEATCRFGFRGICNSVGVRDRYLERGGTGEYFDPCVDTEIFNPAGRINHSLDRSPRLLFWYARPSHPRNCFELAADAFRIVKSRHGGRVRIVAAGAEWNPKSEGLAGIVENQGLLRYRETAALYRRCHAGFVMMMTCHPSYLPLELMACGTLVISNRNPHNSWLLKDRVNCLLADNSASRIADAIEEGLFDDNLRSALTEEAVRLITCFYGRWDEQAEKVYQYICRES